ncbi:TIR domain-containing protein [Lactobacillus johnsonii]|uniref:Thoeris protein ThsB TIR-like domain-containing protein n=1 Tax=Lactobacillus johnsonii TaxID=33959 RepID=A0A9X7T9L3_LACJH|nr:TIR domain-containing protein [Lactobacillus johnsonii]QIA87670.1 hypothetical protein FEE39_04865 [Lactobacillus johnsonii]TGY31573.1 hypothetical protein E5350_00295 [Lactobacillus johnsonii]
MRKTFISYKYSESRDIRDRILQALGPEATKFYRGETAESPDLTDFTTDTIKNHLKDMIYNTSVTILIISPHMKESNWISWELEYALKNQKRGDIYSHSNGIVGVIANQWDNGAWFKQNEYRIGNRLIQHSCLPDIVVKNRMNKKNRFSINYDSVNSESYISMVSENTFLSDPQYYIESAYEKSQRLDEFYIIKQSEKDRREREFREKIW